MSCEYSLASCMSKSAFFWVQAPQWWSTWGLDTQGAVGVPGSALYLKVVGLHLSDKFSPLSSQIVQQFKGRARKSLFLWSCWCQIWDLPTLGWCEHMPSMGSGRGWGWEKSALFQASLTWLIWASSLFQLRDWDTVKHCMRTWISTGIFVEIKLEGFLLKLKFIWGPTCSRYAQLVK